MPKKTSEKLWYKAHPDKVKQYYKQYMKDKTQASVVLDAWVRDKIDSAKQPNQSYGNWIRLLLEDWASNQ